jgi:hypothetical protein
MRSVRAWIGYPLVAVGCMLGGLALAGSDLEKPHLRELGFFLLSVIGPYLMYGSIYGTARRNNGVILPQKVESPEWMGYVPVTVLIIPIIFYFMGEGYKWQLDLWLPQLLKWMGAIAPFHIWAIGIGLVAKSETIYKERLLYFRNKTLLPGLLTCAIPLVYGWSTGLEGYEGIGALVIVDTLLMLIWAISIAEKDGRIFVTLFVVAASIATVGTVLLVVPNPSGESQVLKAIQTCFFALVTASLLGLSESACVALRVRHDRLLIDADTTSNSSIVKRRYESGYNAAVVLIVPSFLATIVLPTANSTYKYLAICQAVLQIFVWMKVIHSMKYRTWLVFFSRAIAVLAILIVAIGFGTPTGESLAQGMNQKGILFLHYIAPLAVLLFSVKLLKDHEEQCLLIGLLLSGKLDRGYFSNSKACLDASIVYAGALAFVSFSIWLIYQVSTFDVASVSEIDSFSSSLIATSALVALFCYQALAWITREYVMASICPKSRMESGH